MYGSFYNQCASFSIVTALATFASFPSIVWGSEINVVGRQVSDDAPLANFGDTVNVLGRMERTDQDFVDGLALDLFSPSNRTLVVQQNKTPLPGNFVTGSTGEGFMSLSNYSWVIRMNETANDLIAKVELPYDPVQLGHIGVQQDNTYVGQLSADRMSWVVSEGQRNVHISENKTRIIKMTSLEGEYMLLGRKSVDSSNIFVQYGQGETRTVNVTGGAGVQEAEFVDGLRFSMVSPQPMRFNANLEFGVNPTIVGQQVMPLNSYAWIINSTAIATPGLKANIEFPVNTNLLQAMQTNSTTDLRVVKQSLNGSDASFSVLQGQDAFIDGRIRVNNVDDLNGRFVLAMVS